MKEYLNRKDIVGDLRSIAEARGNVAGVPPVEFTEQEGIAIAN